MVAWLLSGDGDIEEVDVDVDRALILPDDKIYRLIKLIGGLTENRRTGSMAREDSLHLSDCK